MTDQGTAQDGGGALPLRILLADDHTMLREAVRRAMESAGVIVVGEAGDGEEAIQLASETKPDVILMDVSMPILNGVEATRRIHKDQPDIAILMLTMHADVDVIRQSLSAGAVGYLVKDSSMNQVIEAVRLASNGDTSLSVELAASMLEEVHRFDQTGVLPVGHTHQETEVESIITRREEEVLQLIAEGLSTPEVAASLYISVKTVKNHLASIYAKLDSRDRTQAVIRALKMGIVKLT